MKGEKQKTKEICPRKNNAERERYEGAPTLIGIVLGVFVEYHLHLLCPFDDELLTGLATAVGDITVFEVSLFHKTASSG